MRRAITLCVLLPLAAPVAAQVTVSTAESVTRQDERGFDVYTIDRGELYGRLKADISDGIPAFDQVLARVRALPASERKALQQAAQHLVRNCPYNHAAVQSVAALRTASAEMAARPMPDAPDAGGELARLARAQTEKLHVFGEVLDRHWMLLEELGVTKLKPADGGGTAPAASPEPDASGASCGAPDCPIAKLTGLMRTVKPRYDTMSKEQKAELGRHTKVVADLTRQMVDSSMVIHYGNHLSRVTKDVEQTLAIAELTEGKDRTAAAYAARSKSIGGTLGVITKMISKYFGGYC